MDDDRMRPVNWLRLVFYVLLGAMILMVGWQEGRLAYLWTDGCTHG